MAHIDIKIDNIQVAGHWMPCEYRHKYRSIQILSLGDVDRADIPASREYSSLAASAEAFYRNIPDNKRIAVLVPQDGVDPNLWLCRTHFKRDLTASQNPIIENAKQ